MKYPTHNTDFIEFLQTDIGVSESEIFMALNHQDEHSGSLPMILWHYGLITVDQLDQIFSRSG